jgi:hypothetical protein
MRGSPSPATRLHPLAPGVPFVRLLGRIGESAGAEVFVTTHVEALDGRASLGQRGQLSMAGCLIRTTRGLVFWRERQQIAPGENEFSAIPAKIVE